MVEKIFEIRINHISNMPEKVKREVIRKAAIDSSKFHGFAKVTYVTASPKRIHSIEPIFENTRDFIDNQIKKEGVEIPIF
jgi:hypothetical protein